MSILFDFIFEIIVELVMEIYLYLASAFFPDANLSGRGKKVIKGISAVIALVFLALLVIGIVILIDNGVRNIWGWICTALGISFIVATVILKIVKR